MSSAGRGARAQKARRNTAGAPHEYDDNDKTIPFLRRLTDMLQENEESISFYRGENGMLGRIVVHDRAAVENEVLPKYFNHSSFASLRRQLNYFAFVRVGKGRRQNSGAVYQNTSVVVLDDILKLKRRTGGTVLNPADIIAAENGLSGLTSESSGLTCGEVPTDQTSTGSRKKRRTAPTSETGENSSSKVPLPPSVSISSFAELNHPDNDDHVIPVKAHGGNTEKSSKVVLDLTDPSSSDTMEVSFPTDWNNPEAMAEISNFAKEDFMLCSVLLKLGGRSP